MLKEPFTHGQIFSFERIIDKEGYLICDTSAVSQLALSSKKVYQTKSFSDFSLDLIEKEIEKISIFLEFMENPKILFTSKVSEEIRSIRDNLGNKIHFLRENYNLRRNGRKSCDEKPIEQIKLEEIHELYNELHRASRRSVFFPGQRQIYSFLEKIVLSVTRNTDAKIDYGFFYRKDDKPRKREDLHADEQLVAAALYLSAFERRNGGILTRDSDIKRILRNTLFYLKNSGQQGYIEIISLLRKNPISLYHAEENMEAKLLIDSSWAYPFEVNNMVSPEKIRTISAEI